MGFVSSCFGGPRLGWQEGVSATSVTQAYPASGEKRRRRKRVPPGGLQDARRARKTWGRAAGSVLGSRRAGGAVLRAGAKKGECSLRRDRPRDRLQELLIRKGLQEEG